VIYTVYGIYIYVHKSPTNNRITRCLPRITLNKLLFYSLNLYLDFFTKLRTRSDVNADVATINRFPSNYVHLFSTLRRGYKYIYIFKFKTFNEKRELFS